MSPSPLKPKLVYIIVNNSVRTSKRTPHFTITKIKWLILFKEIITVYMENPKKPINTKCSLQTVRIAGIYNYHYASKG
jgi:hypothetical protein